MKNIFSILLVALLFAACDKIDGPYSENPQNTNDTGVVRKVLIEDFTGQKCGNCPRAAEAIEAIEAIYGKKVVSVGIHVGYFAEPNPQGNPKFTYDFRTPVGDYWDNVFQNSAIGLPNGAINRVKSNGFVPQNYTNWSTLVSQILTQEADADIAVTNTYNAGTRQVNTTVNTKILNDLPGNYMLSVYVTEDSIVNWQKDYTITPDNDISNYVHRHVLRGSMNGNVGTAVGTGALAAGQSYSQSFSMTLDPSWVQSHCAIVAFIYNTVTKEVVQVEEQKIIE